MQMFALIPHPTEQKILAEEQKKILSQLNAENPVYYLEFPLWIFFDFDNLTFTFPQKRNENNINLIEEKEEKFEIEKVFKKNVLDLLTVKAKNGTAELKKLLQEIKIFPCRQAKGQVFWPTKIIFRTGSVLHAQILVARMQANVSGLAQLDDTEAVQQPLCRCKVFRLAQTECEVALGGTKIWSVTKSRWVKL